MVDAAAGVVDAAVDVAVDAVVDADAEAVAVAVESRSCKSAKSAS